jgi:chromosome segregation protein
LEKRMAEKEKDVAGLVKSMGEKIGLKDGLKEKIRGLTEEQEKMGERIHGLNKDVQAATGVEQEELHDHVANAKAALEGLRVRKESQEHRQDEVEQRVTELKKGMPGLEEEIAGLRKAAPGMAQKAEALTGKKKELAEIEERRKALGKVHSSLEAARTVLEDKEKRLASLRARSESLIGELEGLGGSGFESSAAAEAAVERTKDRLGEIAEKIERLSEERLEEERKVSGAEAAREIAEEQWKKVQDLETCPLCQTEMTDQHKDHVKQDRDTRVASGERLKAASAAKLEELENEKGGAVEEQEKLREDLKKAEGAVVALRLEQEKQSSVRVVVEEEKGLQGEVQELREKIGELEAKRGQQSGLDGQYEGKLLEIEELSSRTAEDVDTTLLYKERELENMRNVIKRGSEDLDEIGSLIGDLEEEIGQKEEELGGLEWKEEALNKRFKALFAERDELQEKMQERGRINQEEQGRMKQVEEQVNYLKIGKAKLDAEHEALGLDRQEFGEVELLSGGMQHVGERLRKSQDALAKIGSINMRALEVYEGVKEEYDRVQEKVDTLGAEKDEILKIIAEIDAKKKRTFMKTFKAMNELFSANFSKLSSKGKAYLEIENKEDIFDGGISIVVKLAKGKYFDVTSLSGGEQTLVALSLLFAIQEHKPYHFYVFDEIDAALDKRNSERLAGLLQQYMKAGQYIVVTHNDALILGSNVLYGVSMHEGVSKVLSLKVEGEIGEK